MQLLTGHRVPTRGRVEVFGAGPYENDAVLARMCFIKEGQRYPDHFRVRDVLAAADAVPRLGRRPRAVAAAATSTCRPSGR